MNLIIRGIKKTYGNLVALDLEELCLTEGIYGLLGPNGAGKSTLMNILTGNLQADAGTILCDGEPIQQMRASYRAKLGYAPQQQPLYPTFTAARFLSYIGALKGLTTAETKEQSAWALEQVGLEQVANKQIRTFSGGMKQRLVIAQAILGDPKLLILDEPTAGLDPRQRIAIRNLISSISKDKTVLIATHVVNDVEHIAKELILLNHGKILQKGSLEELVESMESSVYEIQLPADQWAKREAEFTGVTVNLYEKLGTVYARILSQEPPTDCQWKSAIPDLEDIYLWHFGGELHAFG